MQTFRPEKAPSDPKEFARWLDRQMLAIQRAANTGSDALPLRVLHVAPSRPQEGWLYNADGTDWDPGDGAGVYRYSIDSDDVGSYVLLGSTGDVVGPAVAVDGHVAVFDGTTGKLLKDSSPLVTTSGLTMTTGKLLGRGSASTGAVEEITVGSGLSLSGTTLTATAGTSPFWVPLTANDGTYWLPLVDGSGNQIMAAV